MFRLSFTTGVLGAEAAEKLRCGKAIQTLRSPNSDLVGELLQSRLKVGDEMEIALDEKVVGHADITEIDRISMADLTHIDAVKGGFAGLPELNVALKRAGYRFWPGEKYSLYRIQFAWLEEA